MEVPYLDRSPLTQKSMDYAYLREHALAFLREHASTSWTDHNAHDPGITLLEALCYAITDLGNRLELPIADIMASQPGVDRERVAKNFPEAHRILSCAPLGIVDYRRFLTDLAGVKNAYLAPSAAPEFRVYYDHSSASLTTTPTTEELHLNGLYDIQIEWEEIDGEDLNDVQFVTTLEVDGTTYEVILVFPYWDELPQDWLRPGLSVASATLEDSVVTLQETDFDDYYAEFTVEFSDATTVTDLAVRFRISPAIAPDNIALNDLMRAALANLITNEAELPQSILQRYKNRMSRVGEQLEVVKQKYLAKRNLCEDVVAFKAIRLQDVGLDLDIDLIAGSDPVKVLAKVLLAVEGYFSPPVIFRSLAEELSDKSPDEIYEGPYLESGFLPVDEFTATQRRNTIYVSDLIALMLREEGVFAVRKLLLSNYINNFPLVLNEASCLDITASDQFVPRLSLRQSSITLTRNGQPITVTASFRQQVIQEMRALKQAFPPAPGQSLLSRPVGEQLALGDFHSVQYDLPQAYAIGEATLGAEAPVKARASAVQLQAFLHLFDQVLANHAGLVNELFDYFSVDGHSTVYPNEPYQDSPGIQQLLRSFTGTDWEGFLQNNDNGWYKLLNEAASFSYDGPGESPLSYLLARYADDFSNLDLVLQDLNTPNITAISEQVKRKYLQAFPDLAAGRSTAFNYGLRDEMDLPLVWDVDNVSGAERIICYKMGWPACTRRGLHNDPAGFFQFYDEQDDDGITERRFRLRNIATGSILLSSSMSYASDADARPEIEEIIQYGRYISNYDVQQAINGTYYFRLFNPEGEIIAWRIQPFSNPEVALAEAERVSTFIYETFSHEGMHVLEHILLRPQLPGDELLEVLQLGANTLINPYAHTVTVVIPSGNERAFPDGEPTASPLNLRWQEPAFLAFLKKTVREEMPANTLVNILALDINTNEDEEDTPSLQNFERAYRRWLETRFSLSATTEAQVLAHNTLLGIINRMYNG